MCFGYMFSQNQIKFVILVSWNGKNNILKSIFQCDVGQSLQITILESAERQSHKILSVFPELNYVQGDSMTTVRGVYLGVF